MLGKAGGILVCVASCLVAAVVLTPELCSAATIYWTGAAGNGNWTDANNWGGAVPTDVAGFNTAITTQPIMNGTASINGMKVESGSNGFSLGGSNALRIGSQGIALAASGVTGPVSITAPVTLRASQTWTNSSAYPLTVGSSSTSFTVGTSTLTIAGSGGTVLSSLSGASGKVTLSSATLSIGSANTSTSYSGVISGTGGLTKVGTGTLTLSGTNTFTAPVTITNGAVAQGSGGTAGNLKLSGGVLELYYGNFTRALGTGTGQVDMSGAGGGGFSAGKSGSALTANLGGSAAQVTWGSGSFVANGQPLLFGSLNRAFQVYDGAAPIDMDVSGAIKGGGGITKTWNGTLRLSGNNTYSGPTMVNAGKLLASNIIGSATGSGPVTVASGGTLGGTGTIGGSLTMYEGGMLAPGESPGVLTVGGPVDLQSGSTLSEVIQGLGVGTGYSQLRVGLGSSSVTLGGSLDAIFSGTWTPTVSDYLCIVNLTDPASTLSGTFSNYAQDSVVSTFGGYSWRIRYNVDADTNNLAFGSGNDVMLTTVVPEPSTLVLLPCGLVAGWLCFRRRRAR